MKVWHLLAIILVIGALIGGGSLLFGTVGLGFQGALQTTIPANSYSVEAIGNNLRAYTFIDSAGRVCTGVYSEQGGSWGDCEFPPNWDADAFMATELPRTQ